MQMRAAVALAIVASVAAVGQDGVTPVSRVVELMKQLATKIEAQGKTEEDLYTKYMCWGKSVVSEKTASNAASHARSNELRTFVADIDAGRIEFTSERTDLEKDIGTLHGDLESAEARRNREQADFDAAKAEMEQAIAALNQAIAVLHEATANSTGVAFLANHGEVSYSEAAAQMASLNRAADLGEQFLDKADAHFLRRLLTGDVPKDLPQRDWKKLNRKATWKLSYKARSGTIMATLKQLLQTFDTNLRDAESQNSQAKALYGTVTNAKSGQRNDAQNSLRAMETEETAKTLNRDEANTELQRLQQEVQDDTRFIGQTQDAMTEKTRQWKERSALRSRELAAVSEAISILTSDQARDVFTKSYVSQGFSFLQESTTSLGARAASVLRNLVKSSRDARLKALVQLATSGNFDAVISTIDDMVRLLSEEEASDLKNKEDCEEQRAANTREAIISSRNIDAASDAISNLNAEIETLAAEIARQQQEVADAEQQFTDASKIRDDENQAFLKSKDDDTEAAAIVGRSIEVLVAFYKREGLDAVGFSQVRAKGSPAGEAPVPPPATWEGNYAGKTPESRGVVEMLKMLKEDIEADIAKATADERTALAEFDKFDAEIHGLISELQDSINTMTSTKADKQGDVVDTKGQRAAEKATLTAVIKRIADAEPGCNYFTINYPVRFKNRQTEMDGLLKAKAILQHAVFTPGPDPNRELRPGDAFLQRRAAGFLQHKA